MGGRRGSEEGDAGVRKFSRRNGWMELFAWASGDGSMSMSWVDAASGAQVQEAVTESDASEFLRVPENEARWRGWEIVEVSGRTRLARPCRRPAHTSRKLVMGGIEYEYSTGESFRRDLAEHTRANTEFKVGGEALMDSSEVLSLMFFLNHEDEFRACGHETREKA